MGFQANISCKSMDYTILPMRARYVLTQRGTARPSIVGGVYEAALSIRYDSPNTVYERLGGLAYLLTWGDENEVDVERLFLAGNPLEASHVRSFTMWLEHRFTNNAVMSPAKRRIFNGILDGARRAETWFINFGYVPTGTGRRAIEISQLLAGQRHAWDHGKRHNPTVDEAPDISDTAIRKIETRLRSSAFAPRASHSALRTYVIWRLTMEYGLRIGEILALRIQDCPLHPGDPLKIVRSDDRDHSDSRGVYAPRPKTRGRSLGAIFSQSVFPQLIWRYVNSHRFTWKERYDGTRRRSPHIPHSFLLVAAGGTPLSRASAHKATRKIAESVGIPFHWHLARHAFFNRAYAAVARLRDEADRVTRMDDLVYWGGWSNPDSLQIYTMRARRQRAESALAVWQKDSTWKALT